MKKPKKRTGPSPLAELLGIMARLRSPQGCPWDREQTHLTLRRYALEEAYELIDAIEEGDDHELADELGDLLLQVVFHCQLAKERGAFDFDDVARGQAEKLIRRHPHVFGQAKVATVEGVWSQWEEIKRAERQGAQRRSLFDGIPRHLPAALRAERLARKARKAGLDGGGRTGVRTAKRLTASGIASQLFALVQAAEARGWSAETLLRHECRRREKQWRKREKKSGK